MVPAMRIPRPLHRALHRVGIEVTHYSRTQEARRADLLRHLGIEDLIDVGANTGQYAQLVRFHGYRHRIWSVEPLQAVYDELAANAVRDPNWRCERLALSGEPGEMTLHVTADTQFSSLLAPVEGLAKARREVAAAGTEVVPVDTLDSLVSRWNPVGPLGLKVDVQGYEAAVLDGAAKTLQEIEFLELEISMRELYQGQVLLPAMLDRVHGLGFRLASAESLWAGPSGISDQINGVFIRG